MNYRVRQINMGLHPSAPKLSRKRRQREEAKHDKETSADMQNEDHNNRKLKK